MYFSQYRRDNDSLKCHFTKEKQYQSASLLLGSDTLRMEWHTPGKKHQSTAIEESWIPTSPIPYTLMSVQLKLTSPLTFDMAVLYALQSHIHLVCNVLQILALCSPYRINQYSTNSVCRVISLAKYSTPILITLHQIPSKQFLFTGKESWIWSTNVCQ